MLEESTQQQCVRDHTATLERAAGLVGGRAELAAALNVAERQLEYWIERKGTAPHSVFLDAIDIIIENAGASSAYLASRAAMA
jgi:hypothetical protein